LKAILAGASLAILASVTGVSAQADVIRSATHSGYARIVFDLSASPKVNARVDGDKLVVTLSEAYDGSLSGSAVTRLSSYVANPQLSDDRKTVTFTLKKGVQIKTMTNGKSAVVDLVDDASVKLTQSAAASPAVSTPVAVAAPSGAVARPGMDSGAMPAGEAIKPVAVRVGDNRSFTRFVFEFDGPTDVNSSTEGGIIQLAFNRAASMDLDAIRKRLPKAIPAFDAKAGGGITNVAMSLPPNGTLKISKDGPRKLIVDVVASTSGPAGVAEVAAASPVKAEVPRLPEKTNEPPKPLPPVMVPVPKTAGQFLTPPAQQKPLSVVVEAAVPQGQRQPIVRIAFPEPTGAAVFQRGDKLYMVFDRAAQFDLTPVSRSLKGLSQPAADYGAVLVVPVAAGAVPQVFRDGNVWGLNFNQRQSRRPEAPLQVASNPGTNGEVVIGAGNASYPVRFKDVDSGDQLVAVALPQTGRAVEAARDFAQFTILPTVSGVAVLSKADGLDVRVTASQVSVGGSLMLSQLGRAGARRLYDFARWSGPDVDFTETRQMLERAAAEAQDANRTAARFQLAQFFLASAHEADALAVLNLMGDQSQALANDPAVRALRGAAHVMREEGASALSDLSDPALNGEPEALLWRAASSAQIGNWQAADELFRQAGGVPSSYPPLMRGKLALLAAEAALKTGDLKRADGLTNLLVTSGIPQDMRDEADLIRARAYLEAGDKRSAIPILESVVARADRRIRLHAEPVLIDLQLKDGTIDRKQAIERLEKVRYGWPGGDLEFRALDKLGGLYLEEADVANALRVWRDASNYFPAKPEAARIRDQLTEAFAGLYDGELSKRVSPLTALALFDDNRDLTPPGPRGDQMIQKLADRLVQVDLLDRATDILNHQMTNRLKGVEKAKVGARLAVVQLLDRKPQDALAALNNSEESNLPPELLAERRQLRAQAWLDENNSERGLAALEGDTSRRADLLRAQLFSRAQKWSEAAEVLNRLTGDPADKKMDAAREGVLVNLAIATALSGDMEKLRLLRDRFGSLMVDRPNNEAFQLLTSGNNGATGMDMMGLTLRFAELSEFQQAMGNYREKLRSGQLSNIN
jgi:tetratricopeptide (TPR) repeat protein